MKKSFDKAVAAARKGCREVSGGDGEVPEAAAGVNGPGCQQQ